MKNGKAFSLVLAAALLPLSQPACAQMYSWKDPNTGQSKLSNIAPPWYSRGEAATGPRVIRMLDGKVVDDTALPYEARLALAGRSRNALEKPQLQKSRDPRAAQDAPRESAGTVAQPANRNAADLMSASAAARTQGS